MKVKGFRAAFEMFLSDPRKYIAALKDWKKLVDEGADPIEAMHGHKCGPDCWHKYEPGKVKQHGH